MQARFHEHVEERLLRETACHGQTRCHPQRSGKMLRHGGYNRASRASTLSDSETYNKVQKEDGAFAGLLTTELGKNLALVR